MAGTVVLAVAVQTYYLAAILAGMADPYTLTAPPTVTWMVYGVLAGLVFGAAGALVRDPRPWWSAAAVAAMAAVFWAEVAVRLVPGSGSGLADLGTSLLGVVAGSAGLLLAPRTPGRLRRAVVLVGPLTLLGIGAFVVGGF